MLGSENEKFETTDAGASMCEKTDTNRLFVGSLIMIKGCPCKLTEVFRANTGKHGSSKVIIKGRDILTSKEYECTYRAGDMVYAPIVVRQEFTVLNIDGDVLELLTPEGEVKSYVNLPEDEHLRDVTNKIREIFETGKKECLVTVLKTLGKEQVIEVREGNDQ